MPDKSYEIIDHTADIGIRIRGKTLQELFINAAEGVVNLIAGVASPSTSLPPQQRRRAGRTCFRMRRLARPKGRYSKVATPCPVNLNAVDREQLLVKWLQEILYLFEVKKAIPAGFKILKLSEKTLAAEVVFVPFDPKKLKYQIKAVTYHKLSVREAPDGWTAEIIFDI